MAYYLSTLVNGSIRLLVQILLDRTKPRNISDLPVGGEHDILVLAELEELCLVEVGVALDLVGRDLGLALLGDVAHLGVNSTGY